MILFGYELAHVAAKFEYRANYKSNLSVLRNFADASSFLLAFFGLFIALMTLLFMFFSSSFANFINKTARRKSFPPFLRGKNFVFVKLSKENYFLTTFPWP